MKYMATGIAKRLVACALVFIASMTHSISQNADVDEVKSKIIAAAKSKKSVECDFVITKRSKLLKEPAVTTGSMAYRKPYAIYWESATPSKTTFTTDGEKATIKKNGETKTIDLKSNKMFKRIKRMTGDGIGIESLMKSDKFDSTVAEEPTEWVLTLIPDRKEIAQFASQMVLRVDKKDCVVKIIEITSKSGDTTTIELKNIKAQ